jgi:hypothetical protein
MQDSLDTANINIKLPRPRLRAPHQENLVSVQARAAYVTVATAASDSLVTATTACIVASRSLSWQPLGKLLQPGVQHIGLRDQQRTARAAAHSARGQMRREEGAYMWQKQSPL